MLVIVLARLPPRIPIVESVIVVIKSFSFEPEFFVWVSAREHSQSPISFYFWSIASDKRYRPMKS